MDNNEVNDAIDLWDTLDESAEVLVPTVITKTNKVRALFVEAVPLSEGLHVMARIFLNKTEALTYAKQKNTDDDIEFVIIKLEKLYKSFDKFFGKKYGKKFDCVLSCIDVDGNVQTVELAWSNTSNC